MDYSSCPRLIGHRVKVLPLEALRGIAAILVVFHHFAMCFLPRYVGLHDPIDPQKALIGTPLFLAVNGAAMVVIFFVLSGYVLSRKGLSSEPGSIADAAIKRWFRLAPLVCLSTLLSWALFNGGLCHFDDAAALSESDWLTNGIFYGVHQTYRPKLIRPLVQGLFGAFVTGDYRLNIPLWTMRWEFVGSMVVFAIALLLPPQRRWWLNVVLPLASIFLINEGIWIFPFLFGLLAVALRLDQIVLGKLRTAAMLIAGLYLCGYYVPIKWYAWLAPLALPEVTQRVLVHSAGGLLLLCVFGSHNPVSERFNGSISSLLGKVSFPLYLINLLIIASFSSWGYVIAKGGAAGVLAASFMFVLTATPLVWIMMRFDGWWLQVLSRWHPAGR